jgi:hypothetical protein
MTRVEQRGVVGEGGYLVRVRRYPRLRGSKTRTGLVSCGFARQPGTTYARFERVQEISEQVQVQTRELNTFNFEVLRSRGISRNLWSGLRLETCTLQAVRMDY